MYWKTAGKMEALKLCVWYDDRKREQAFALLAQMALTYFALSPFNVMKCEVPERKQKTNIDLSRAW